MHWILAEEPPTSEHPIISVEDLLISEDFPKEGRVDWLKQKLRVTDEQVKVVNIFLGNIKKSL